MIPLTERTREHVRVLFSVEEVAVAEHLLAEGCAEQMYLTPAATPESLERIRFAALRLSGGTLDGLRSAVALAQLDWRDLLMYAGFGENITAHLRWHPRRSERPP